MKNTIISCRFITVLSFILMSTVVLFSHPGHSHGKAKKKTAKRGKGFTKSGGTFDENTRVHIDVYGNINFSLNNQLNGGDPLGVGGQIPWYYNVTIGSEVPYNALAGVIPSGDRDYRVESSDFGYIPLWDEGELSFSLKYRFAKNLFGEADMGFSEVKEPGAGGGTTWNLALSQVVFNWIINKKSHLRVGHLSVNSNYAVIFGQMPLTSSIFQGAQFNYSPTDNFSLSLSGGTTFLNRTFNTNTEEAAYWHAVLTKTKDLKEDSVAIDKVIHGHEGTYGTTRLRSTVLGKGTLKLNNITINGEFGAQYLPKDSSENYVVTENKKGDLPTQWDYQVYEPAFGWKLGIEVEHNFKDILEHSLSIGYGMGDIEMGLGKPSSVLYRREIDIKDKNARTDLTYYSSTGSSLLNVAYWGTLSKSKFSLDYGVWFAGHTPASNPLKWEFQNGWYKDDDGNVNSTLTDSLAEILFPGYTKVKDLPDSVIIDTEPYRTVKFAVEPSYQFGDIVNLGFRYDHIRHLDPQAHTNTQEWKKNSVLDPVYVDKSAYLTVMNGFADGWPQTQYEPSKWELEAVNANVITPYINLTIKDILSIKAAYSMGFYSDVVRRHNQVSDFHSNFILSANLNYSFSSGKKDDYGKKSNKLISKQEAMIKASHHLVQLIREKAIPRSWIEVVPDKAVLKNFGISEQWRVHFYNDAIDDDETCDLYIFLSPDGHYLNYNHFGE